ncbi:hypothetical protein IAQ61_000593 [Plenodomus lingam]|uniref:uncharacterized protein n=1 Tax=Leptosphaeria maculans TaxID=5022 RepID=UPI00332DCC53|nr:hypothetical protein IAQ61_000593 [Plenodomus lingam]
MSFRDALGASLSFLSCIWIPGTLLCCIPWVQKQMLYLHNITFFPGKWLDEPERAGFLNNQVAPFTITTSDTEKLFAWLITPLGVYAKHVDDFIKEQSVSIEDHLAFRLLRNDPDARLLLYFHGNSATIAQERRTIEYRSYSSGASEKMFILAFDYRGFGKSTGNPSEPGLLDDADAVIDWALNTARISSDRIVLLGHSLGTAVVAGVAHRYAKREVEFAGLVLCAAFTNAGNAFSSYSVGGIVPVLAPLKLSGACQRWFSGRMRDTWRTDDRLAHLARTCPQFQLVLVHAEDDTTMPWHETEALFQSTIKAAKEASLPINGTDSTPEVVDMGEAGRQEVWKGGSRCITKMIAKHGGHNASMTWSPVALTILQVFGITAPVAHT